MEEEHNDADWGDLKLTPLAVLVDPMSTTSDDRPNMTSSTTWEPLEPKSTEPRGVDVVEEEVTSLRDAPCHSHHVHPHQ
jgi:hypothetical protein